VSAKGRWRRSAFWGGIFASCVWFAVTIVFAFTATRQAIDGELPLGWNIFTLIFFARIVPPFVVAALLAWAVRLRKSGSAVKITMRALSPLLTLPLIHLNSTLLYSSWSYSEWRLRTGSISYVCGLDGFPPNVIGGRELILSEHRRMEGASSWNVTRPGNKPMETVAFPYQTQSIGGSQGIKWREADGRTMTALLSLSDAIIEHWRSQVWAILVEGDASAKRGDLSGMKTESLTCTPDPASYRP
jgi:hypothetical protein